MQTINDNGWNRIDNVIDPILDFYPVLKEISNGTAMVLCPSGGYSVLPIDHEGIQIPKWFNNIGVTAFFLKYSLPSNKIMTDKTIKPLHDELYDYSFGTLTSEFC